MPWLIHVCDMIHSNQGASLGIWLCVWQATLTCMSWPIHMCVFVLFCFIKPILGNRYVRSRGFIVSEPRETQPRSEIACDVTYSNDDQRVKGASRHGTALYTKFTFKCPGGVRYIFKLYLSILWRNERSAPYFILSWGASRCGHMCDTPHSKSCAMTYPYFWNATFMCVPWCIYMCDMTHSDQGVKVASR